MYVVYFKCNKARVADYPNLRNYCRDLYQTPGIAETVRPAGQLFLSSFPRLFSCAGIEIYLLSLTLIQLLLHRSMPVQVLLMS